VLFIVKGGKNFNSFVRFKRQIKPVRRH
jgi:hypothetical protein